MISEQFFGIKLLSTSMYKINNKNENNKESFMKGNIFIFFYRSYNKKNVI